MRKNLTGVRIGRLVVQEFAGIESKWRNATWNCICDCGNIKILSTNALSKVKSCGCLQKEIVRKINWKGYEEIGKDYWTSLQKSAKYRNLEFSLTIEYAWNLYLEQSRKCHLSGELICFDGNRKSGRQTASLDRINSNFGYVVGNVQWLHKKINMCKITLSNEEFVEVCNMVSKRFQNAQSSDHNRSR